MDRSGLATTTNDPMQLGWLLDTLALPDVEVDAMMLYRAITGSDPGLVKKLLTGQRKKALAARLREQEDALPDEVVRSLDSGQLLVDLGTKDRAELAGIIDAVDIANKTGGNAQDKLDAALMALSTFIAGHQALHTVEIDGQKLPAYLAETAQQVDCNNQFVTRIRPLLAVVASGMPVPVLIRRWLTEKTGIVLA